MWKGLKITSATSDAAFRLVSDVNKKFVDYSPLTVLVTGVYGGVNFMLGTAKTDSPATSTVQPVTATSARPVSTGEFIMCLVRVCDRAN